MSLKLVVDNEGDPAGPIRDPHQQLALPPASVVSEAEAADAVDVSAAPAQLPPKPDGAVPIVLAQLLRSQEPVIWWSTKQEIQWQPAAWAAFAGALLMTFASLFAPELWKLPWLELLSVIMATQGVAIVILVREWTSRRHVLVTDTAVADIDWRGNGDRIAFRNVRKVKRDWWSGGVRLIGEAHEVRIPPSLMDDTRAAIAYQMAFTLDFGTVQVEDPLSWFPQRGGKR